MQWKIALSEPAIGHEEIEAVSRVLQSKWLTMGSVTAEFEAAFAVKLGVKHAFAVSNGTAALHLANLALGVSADDEVICPALTFVATANASRYTGAVVRFADVVSEYDLTIDPRDIARKISRRTKAISVMHYGGFACHMERIVSLAQEHGLKVIEDSAHAPFAKYRFADGSVKSLGAIGDVGCFSFFGNKNMTTGEGGMIVTNDDELAERIRLFRSHGMTTLSYERHRGHASGYDVLELGFNYRLDELRSAIGLCQLGKIDHLNERRRDIYRWYIEEFADYDGVRVPFADRDLGNATPHIMSIIVSSGSALREHLRSCGIQTSRHYPLVTSFSIYGSDVDRTLWRSDALVTLPLGPHMSKGDVTFVTTAVRGFRE